MLRDEIVVFAKTWNRYHKVLRRFPGVDDKPHVWVKEWKQVRKLLNADDVGELYLFDWCELRNPSRVVGLYLNVFNKCCWSRSVKQSFLNDAWELFKGTGDFAGFGLFVESLNSLSADRITFVSLEDRVIEMRLWGLSVEKIRALLRCDPEVGFVRVGHSRVSKIIKRWFG